jgi:hypothetical protein
MTCLSTCCDGGSSCQQATVPALACVSAAGARPGGSTACPDGCQAKIDRMYFQCGGCDVCSNGTCFDWDSTNTNTKAAVEAAGCNSAEQADPAIFVAIAAVVGHFLN